MYLLDVPSGGPRHQVPSSHEGSFFLSAPTPSPAASASHEKRRCLSDARVARASREAQDTPRRDSHAVRGRRARGGRRGTARNRHWRRDRDICPAQRWRVPAPPAAVGGAGAAATGGAGAGAWRPGGGRRGGGAEPGGGGAAPRRDASCGEGSSNLIPSGLEHPGCVDVLLGRCEHQHQHQRRQQRQRRGHDYQAHHEEQAAADAADSQRHGAREEGCGRRCRRR